MRVVYHPEFPQDIKRYLGRYAKISPWLGLRFRAEVDSAINAIKSSPGSAGHFLNTGSQIVREVRRRNLESFPFFVLYGVAEETLVFRSVIPSSSDPLGWLERLPVRS
jgi:hypothetical protein